MSCGNQRIKILRALKEDIIQDASVLFFDFDGVIKESVSVKADAFEQLFLPHSIEVAQQVREHHEANSGMSRYEKLPIYLALAGLKVTAKHVAAYSQRFSDLVKQQVIDSDWIDGVESFLHTNPFDQTFFIVTATPQSEIEEIIDAIGLTDRFSSIVGSPTKKDKAIHDLIKQYNIDASTSIMIGDAMADYHAAVKNDVAFVLRITDLNKPLQERICCPIINDFIEL
jgi:phosphoglycolate phosphatase-like HAD superfamily hydrolase